MKPAANNTIALIMGIFGIAATMVVFMESRGDPGLRMAALVAATSAGASLIAIASTLLTGKDLTNHDSNLPPGASSTQISEVKIPPIPTTAAEPPNPTKQ